MIDLAKITERTAHLVSRGYVAQGSRMVKPIVGFPNWHYVTVSPFATCTTQDQYGRLRDSWNMEWKS